MMITADNYELVIAEKCSERVDISLLKRLFSRIRYAKDILGTVDTPSVLLTDTQAMTTSDLLRLRQQANAVFTILPVECANVVCESYLRPKPTGTMIYDAIHRHGYEIRDSTVAARSLDTLNTMLRNGQAFERLFFGSHGEGGHLKLQDLTICGLLDAVEVDFNGVPIPNACNHAACRRQGKGPMINASALRASHLVMSTCNGISVGGEGFPSTSNVAISALLNGHTTLVTSSCSPAYCYATASVMLSRLWDHLPWWFVEHILNSIAETFFGFASFVSLGIPSDLSLPNNTQVSRHTEIARHLLDKGNHLYMAWRANARRTAIKQLQRKMKALGTTSVIEALKQPSSASRQKRHKFGQVSASQLESSISLLLIGASHRHIQAKCKRCSNTLHRYQRMVNTFSEPVQAYQLLCPVCGVVMSALRKPGAMQRPLRQLARFEQNTLRIDERLDFQLLACALSLKAGSKSAWRAKTKKRLLQPRWPTSSPSEIDTLRAVIANRQTLAVARVRAVRIVPSC